MKKTLSLFLLAIAVAISQSAQAQIITTVAGNGTPALSGNIGDNGAATAAELYGPAGVAVDDSGNLYIADVYYNSIRKVNTSGIITTIAGGTGGGFSGDNGAATAAKIEAPTGVAVDDSGNLYIADESNNRIRKVNTSGIITTIAGNGTFVFSGDNGAATAAELNEPQGIAIDDSGNIYIADAGNNRIRKVNTSGIITTIAGNGTGGYNGDNIAATDAKLSSPAGVAVDDSGNIYIADNSNNRIRKVNTSGIITTIAGNGTPGVSGDNGAATAAKFTQPQGVAIDGSGNVYIVDYFNNRIRKVNNSGVITTFAGTSIGYGGDNGAATAAKLNNPDGIAVDGNGNVYIADQGNYRVRKVTALVTAYYYNGTGSVTALTSYGTHINGSGTNPSSFILPGVTYYIANAASPITLSANLTAGSATGGFNISSGTQLNLNGYTLSVAGNINDSGTITGAGSMVLNGTAAQTITGNGIISNLTLNNAAGATIATGSNISITGVYTNTAGTLTADSALTLVSNIAGTGRIAAITAGSIAGKVNVQQYIPGKRTFRFFAHPFSTSIGLNQLENYIDVTGTGGSANGFTTTLGNNPSAFWYNPVTGNGSTVSDNTGWVPFTSAYGTGSNAWSAYQGIRVLIRGTQGQGLDGNTYTPSAATFTLSGVVNQGAITIPFVKGSNSGYNLLGNPYPSPVDIGTPIYTAKQAGTISGAAFWVWDAGQQTQGAYVTVPIANTVYSVPANASFMINAASAGNLLFAESNKTSTATTLFKIVADNGLVTLHLYDSSFNSWDELYLSFNQNASDSMEDNDAVKMHNSALDFYSLSSNDKKLSIDARPYENGHIIPLGIQTGILQTYIIKTESLNVPAGVQLMLHDKYLNEYQQLQVGSQYRFSITTDTASQGNNRFEIGTSVSTGVGIVNGNNNLKVSMLPNPAAEQVTITYEAQKSEHTAVRLMNMAGQNVVNIELGTQQSGSVNVPLHNVAAGMYMVVLISGNQSVTQRLIKQ